MTETDRKRGRGRPRKVVDAKIVREMAAIGCTAAEIGAVVGCSVDTLDRNFADALKEGREAGRATLRRMQWAAAKKGNPTMLIWLGKQMLGQKDRIGEDVPGDLT